MAKAPSVEPLGDIDLDGAVVLLAFPTTGAAASIAAQYLVRNLTLPLVGHVRIPELAGLVSVQDGRVTSTVRVYGGDVVCKVGRSCPRIYVVTTDLALPPPVMARLGDTVMAWAKGGGAHMLIVLEGVGRLPGDETPDVFCAAGDAAVLKMLVKAGIPAMGRALLGGIAAQVLMESAAHGVKAGALLVEASRDHPDGRAAAALVEAVAKIVPDVQVDAKPLQVEAAELEREIRLAQARAEQAQALPPAQSFI